MLQSFPGHGPINNGGNKQKGSPESSFHRASFPGDGFLHDHQQREFSVGKVNISAEVVSQARYLAEVMRPIGAGFRGSFALVLWAKHFAEQIEQMSGHADPTVANLEILRPHREWLTNFHRGRSKSGEYGIRDIDILVPTSEGRYSAGDDKNVVDLYNRLAGTVYFKNVSPLPNNVLLCEGRGNSAPLVAVAPYKSVDICNAYAFYTGSQAVADYKNKYRDKLPLHDLTGFPVVDLEYLLVIKSGMADAPEYALPERMVDNAKRAVPVIKRLIDIQKEI